MYGNGYGAVDNHKDGKRVDLSSNPLGELFIFETFLHDIMVNAVAGKDYRYDGAVPLKIETHGGDDVGIFASGPWAHLFSGVMNQNTIPHLMAYAACIGDGLTNCS